jgi:meso-butanediol dehydrogenase/(S,S)-butanediol dehydrogenase/diacetyl reductase
MATVPQRLVGKTALITGAASGIGRATAVRFAAEGAQVFCADIQAEAGEAAAAEIRAAGGDATFQVCDVSDEASIVACVAAAVERYGKLDNLNNIAGLGHFEESSRETLAGWNRIIGINLTGTFLFCREAIPHLLATRGSITNCASTAATKGQPWSAAYSASKGGVISLTQTLAVDYGRQGMRVNAIAPGGVDTPIAGQFTPPEGVDVSLMVRIMPLDPERFGHPDELAAGFAYLASDDASYVNGIVLRIDGGMQA